MIPSDNSLTDDISPVKFNPETVTWYYRLTVSNETDKLDTDGTF
jgi:hypothetical protein